VYDTIHDQRQNVGAMHACTIRGIYSHDMLMQL